MEAGARLAREKLRQEDAESGCGCLVALWRSSMASCLSGALFLSTVDAQGWASPHNDDCCSRKKGISSVS